VTQTNRAAEIDEIGGSPLISVILAVRDRRGSVARAIESVLAQTYQNRELIIVDDGSTDGTREVLERFADVATIVHQQHGGVYAARNRALRLARGDLVAFIDSDDSWLPTQVPLMRNQQVAIAYGDAFVVTAPVHNARRMGRTLFDIVPPRRGRVASAFVWGNFIPTCTALVRRSCLEEIGAFAESSQRSADYLAWFQIGLRHAVDYVDEPLADYTVHADGVSADLGQSLAARIQLFSRELLMTREPDTQRLIRRLLFNLGLHLALAAVRGRARNTPNAFGLAWCTAGIVGRAEALVRKAAFLSYHLRWRTRRLFS
jgi:glycosyl transferase family 2